MRLHLPASLRCALFLTAAGAACTCPATAAVLNPDVSMMTYTDFGQNKGRYAVGNTNALLDHLRRDGVALPYGGGQADYTLDHGMIDFGGLAQNGAGTVLGFNSVVTVRHNAREWVPNLFSANAIGADKCIGYTAVEYPRTQSENTGSDVFQQTPGDYDYKVSRLNKLVTDVDGAAVYSGKTDSSLVGQLLYRAGGGLMLQPDGKGSTVELCAAHQYITGGIETIDEVTAMAANGTCHVKTNYAWASEKVGDKDTGPLPFKGDNGDSGSPAFIWNAESGRYEYLAALVSGTPQSLNNYSTACAWTQETLASHDKVLKVNALVNLGAVTTPGETITDSMGRSTTLYSGVATDAMGEELGRYNGIVSGRETWASLDSIKDVDNWYNQVDDFFSANVGRGADLCRPFLQRQPRAAGRQ